MDFLFMSKLACTLLFPGAVMYSMIKTAATVNRRYGERTLGTQLEVVNGILPGFVVFAMIYGLEVRDIRLFYLAAGLVAVFGRQLCRHDLFKIFVLSVHIYALASAGLLWGIARAGDTTVFTVGQFLCVNVFALLCGGMCLYWSKAGTSECDGSDV